MKEEKGAIHVGSGEFTVCKESAVRKLSAEKRKIWRHRIGLVWLVMVLPAIKIAGAITLADFLIGLVRRSMFPVSSSNLPLLIFSWVIAAMVVALLLLVGVAIFENLIHPLGAAAYEEIYGRFRLIKDSWNAPSPLLKKIERGIND